MSARLEIPLGIFHGVPIAHYHSGAGISCSGLADFAKSPYHFHALHLNPDRPAEEETAAQLVGNLAHCAILEPAEFAKRYVVGPNVRRGTKVWDAFEASLTPAQTGIKFDQAETAQAQAQAASVRALPDVAKLLAVGAPEVSAFWIDPVTGELCRCRPDWTQELPGNRCILVDLKTVGSAAPVEFAKQVSRMRYANQCAWYSDGYAAASGRAVVGFVFIAVETAWPFAAAAYMLPEEWIEIARRENAELLGSYSDCRAKHCWPSYAESVQLLEMPSWVPIVSGRVAAVTAFRSNQHKVLKPKGTP